MKVQKIKTQFGDRYLLLDDKYQIIDEVYRFLKYLDICGKSPSTLRSYALHLKLYYEYMHDNNIDVLALFDNKELKPVDILCRFIFWLQYPDAANGTFNLNGENAKRSNSTINTIMSTVLSFYQYLSSNNEVSEASVYKIKKTSYQYKSFLYEMMHHNTITLQSILRKPNPPKQVAAITRNQYIELIQATSNLRDKLMIALMFEGGLRLSETIGLHIEDLTEIQDGIISIVPRENNENNARVKNYAAGIIKVPDYIIDLIVLYLEEISEYNSEYLFINISGPNKGSPLRADTVEKLFLRLSKKINMKVTPHMLRHGFATEKLEAGWQMIDIQAYLRHKNLSSTQIYATYSNELKKEKMRNFFDQNADYMRKIANEIQNI